jgi:hypothetical protein
LGFERVENKTDGLKVESAGSANHTRNG